VQIGIWQTAVLQCAWHQSNGCPSFALRSSVVQSSSRISNRNDLDQLVSSGSALRDKNNGRTSREVSATWETVQWLHASCTKNMAFTPRVCGWHDDVAMDLLQSEARSTTHAGTSFSWFLPLCEESVESCLSCQCQGLVQAMMMRLYRCDICFCVSHIRYKLKCVSMFQCTNTDIFSVFDRTEKFFLFILAGFGKTVGSPSRRAPWWWCRAQLDTSRYFHPVTVEYR